MLHVITGPPCAGKSTHVQQHAQPDELRIDYDAIATTLGAATPHDANGNVKAAAFAARDALIEHALANPEHETWVIHTTPTAEQRAAYAAAGADVLLLDPGLETCLERAQQSSRPDRTAEAITQWYEKRSTDAQKSVAAAHLALSRPIRT